MRRAVRVLLAVVVVGGVLFLFVWPGRTWLDQSRAMAQTQRQINALSQENKVLGNEANELQKTSYVEQQARQQYGLVLPGEQAYGILPPEATTTTSTTIPHRGHHGRS